MKYTTS